MKHSEDLLDGSFTPLLLQASVERSSFHTLTLRSDSSPATDPLRDNKVALPSIYGPTKDLLFETKHYTTCCGVNIRYVVFIRVIFQIIALSLHMHHTKAKHTNIFKYMS